MLVSGSIYYKTSIIIVAAILLCLTTCYVANTFAITIDAGEPIFDRSAGDSRKFASIGHFRIAARASPLLSLMLLSLMRNPSTG
jgi:hypothetical protein